MIRESYIRKQINNLHSCKQICVSSLAEQVNANFVLLQQQKKKEVKDDVSGKRWQNKCTSSTLILDPLKIRSNCSYFLEYRIP